MIVVVDCNVVISAGVKDGFVRSVLRQIIDRHVIVVSPEIIAEYERASSYSKFDFDAVAHMRDSIDRIEGTARFVELARCEFASPDPEDTLYIEAAIVGGADFLITGNAKHFPDGRYGKTRVVSVRAFAELAGLVP